MVELGYKARGGSGYNTRNRRSNRSKKVGGRSQTERSAEAYRQWVYSQNPDAKKLSDPEVVRIKNELGHYDRYKQETLQQQQKNRLEAERNIKLLKREYVEDLKDFRNGKYPSTTLNELRSDYIRELNMYLKQLKNPYPKLIPEDSGNYGP